MDSILIVAGENSGEKYGAGLVHQFKKLHPSFTFFGIGGRHMSAEGVEIIAPMEELTVMGGKGAIFRLPRIKALFDRMKKEAVRRMPVASVLIDSPDFNLRLGKKLKKLSIPVLYYISPTVWAWRKGRLKTIKKIVDKMLLIFPFEEKIYNTKGIPHAYVGHPLKESIKVTFTKENFFLKYRLDAQKKLIALLPGSRKSELKYHLPVLMKTIPKIKTEIPAQFILILAENFNRTILQDYITQPSDDLQILSSDKYEAIASSDLVLSSCGTANLESALSETPLISFYRVSPFDYYLGVKLIKIKHYSIVNILAGKKIIPELIQNDFTPNNIFQEAKKILESDEIKAGMVSNFKKIKEILGDKKASQNAARELEEIIQKRKEKIEREKQETTESN